MRNTGDVGLADERQKVTLAEVELEQFPPKPRRSKFSDERKAEIIAAIENEYGGSINKAGESLGINPASIRGWYNPNMRGPRSKKVVQNNENQHPMPKLPPQELIDAKRMQLTDVFEKIILKYASYISDADLEEAKTKPNVAAVTLGIMFDKLQIMKGQPTHITQTNVRYMEQGSLRTMARERLKVLQGGKDEGGDGGQNPPQSATA